MSAQEPTATPAPAAAGAQTSVVMVRYRVKPESVARNVELLRAVHEEVHAARPEGLRYASFQLDDKVTFVELVIGGGQGRLAQLKTFRAYRSTIEERLEAAPVLEELSEVGSFGFRR